MSKGKDLPPREQLRQEVEAAEQELIKREVNTSDQNPTSLAAERALRQNRITSTLKALRQMKKTPPRQ